jgi:DNA-binding CsgD family transcriptional regulator
MRSGDRQHRSKVRTIGTEHDLALEVWTALLEGHWTVLADVDQDGRRWILARQKSRRPVLSAAEQRVLALATAGQADKLIAFTLGVSRNTVVTHLSRAAAKLGVQTRLDLISLPRERT